jgi:hypothetical protein
VVLAAGLVVVVVGLLLVGLGGRSLVACPKGRDVLRHHVVRGDVQAEVVHVLEGGETLTNEGFCEGGDETVPEDSLKSVVGCDLVSHREVVVNALKAEVVVREGLLWALT